MIVIDASAVVAALTTRGEAADRLRRRLGDELAHAPHLVDVEVLSAVRRLTLRRTIEASQGDRVIEHLRQWSLHRHSHRPLISRVHALRASLSSYDATYVALAELLDLPLVTCDGRLARSHGHTARVEHHPI